MHVVQQGQGKWKIMFKVKVLKQASINSTYQTRYVKICNKIYSYIDRFVNKQIEGACADEAKCKKYSSFNGGCKTTPIPKFTLRSNHETKSNLEQEISSKPQLKDSG